MPSVRYVRAALELAAASLNLSEDGNLREAAANLFDYMKRLDRLGSAVIAVEPIPFNGLGEAINDRLVRAAAPRIPSMTDGTDKMTLTPELVERFMAIVGEKNALRDPQRHRTLSLEPREKFGGKTSMVSATCRSRRGFGNPQTGD